MDKNQYEFSDRNYKHNIIVLTLNNVMDGDKHENMGNEDLKLAEKQIYK